MMYPVLEAIHLLIKSDGHATRASIKQISPELSHRHIAETLAANSDLLRHNKKRQITGLLSFSFTDMTKHGRKFYQPYEFTNSGQHLFDALTFPDADDLKEQHKDGGWIGGIGDCYYSTATKDSPELRAELEARGYRLWDSSFGATDAFWKEPQQ